MGGPDSGPAAGDGREDAGVVGQWPDGTAITLEECRAPDDARELFPDFKRLHRERRRVLRRARLARCARALSSPRVVIALVMLAALVASAVALLLPTAR